MSTKSAVASGQLPIPAEFPFTVVAGKYEGDGTTGGFVVNIKYIDSFRDLDSALAALHGVDDYPYAVIEYGEVTLQLTRREQP